MPVTRAVAAVTLAVTVLWSLGAAALGLSALFMWEEWEPIDDWYAPAIAVTTPIGLWGAYGAVRPLWRTARRGEERGRALARFAIAWLAFLPWGCVLIYAGFIQVAFTVMAVPVAAVLLLAEHCVRSRHDHSGSPAP